MLRFSNAQFTTRWCKRRENRLCAQASKQHLEMLTGDFELLDCFVALILDFDFDWDCLPVEIELQTRIRQLESVTIANVIGIAGKTNKKILLVYIFIQ